MSEGRKVAVVGANGRMGTAVCQAVATSEDLHLVGRYDLGDDIASVRGADVVVEFSVPGASFDNVLACLEAGADVVVGTTGWDGARLKTLEERLAAYPERGVLIAPNFAIGALLMMSFARRAARFYESAEIIELHHPEKVDAPSGTATRTASLIAAARAEAGLPAVPDATVTDPRGARGADVDGIHVHGVRLRGLVAHQEVLFGAAGEGLTIRHDSYDRGSFMPGVLAAVRAIGSRPGLTVGLEHILGIA